MQIMPGANALAYLVLVAFVPLAVIVFGRLRPPLAAAVLALAGCLFLPEGAGFNLELMPPVGKENVTWLSILLGAAVHRARWLGRARPGRGPEALLVAMALGNLATVWANPDPVRAGRLLIPGLTAYAALSLTIADAFRYVLPFFLGRAFFRSSRDLRDLLILLAAAGLLYSLFALAEIPLSWVFRVFQFGNWFYGVVTVPSWRYGGLQPVVFLANPLALAMFFVSSAIAASALAKAGVRVFRLPPRPSWLWLLYVLVLCRNVAAVIYGASTSLLVSLMRPRQVAAVACALAFFVCTYPALRMADWVPHREMVALAERYDPARARSLGGRFAEEETMLANARDRLWFGWGEYDRLPFEQDAPNTARSLDGFWVILVGTQGLLGFELRIALLLLPIASAWRRLPRVASVQDRVLVAGLMVIVAVRAVDLLPNGWWTSLPAFLAGALYGLARGLGPTRAGRGKLRRRAPASGSPASAGSPPAGVARVVSPGSRASGATPADPPSRSR